MQFNFARVLIAIYGSSHFAFIVQQKFGVIISASLVWYLCEEATHLQTSEGGLEDTPLLLVGCFLAGLHGGLFGVDGGSGSSRRHPGNN